MLSLAQIFSGSNYMSKESQDLQFEEMKKSFEQYVPSKKEINYGVFCLEVKSLMRTFYFIFRK